MNICHLQLKNICHLQLNEMQNLAIYHGAAPF